MNTTLISNITSLQGLAYYTNSQVSRILFGDGIFVLYLVMMLILLKNSGFEEPFINVFAVTSWVMFIVSIFFWYANLVSALSVLAFLICAAISVLLMYSNKTY